VSDEAPTLLGVPTSATSEARLTAEVADLLAALIPGVEAALGDILVGIYLRGSLATGDFIETSDIDFLVATSAQSRTPKPRR
jgi:predicted nucleotidyltransferase